MGFFKTLSTMGSAAIQCTARHLGEWAQRSLVDSQNESREFYESIGGVNQIIENGIVSQEVRDVLLGKLPTREEWEKYKEEKKITLPKKG